MTLKHAVLAAFSLVVSADFAAPQTTWYENAPDVLIIGEFHDNSQHHQTQASAVAHLMPNAVVYEMLTPDEADALRDVPRAKGDMIAATAGFHWSNIADYADILAAGPVIIGASLSRADMRAAFSDGASTPFGSEASTYGLTTPLPQDEQTLREDLQFDAHCQAMPREMMGGMVEAQRLRDAAFARAVIAAYDTYGGPIVLITGNGHARTDWGVPVYIAAARPDLSVISVGQGEAGTDPVGSFDHVLNTAPVPDRGDPCAAFAVQN